MKENLLYFLDKSKDFLEKKGIPSARLDAELILADILGLERIKLYSKFDMPLSPAEQDIYRKKIIERSNFKPVAYITGKKYFYHDEFIVNESVLIPRPETEELIEWVLNENQGSHSVLDLCTGSGCIGITLKKERPEWQVTLSDISSAALSTAKLNQESILLNLDLSILESNLFKSFPADNKFDIIISNPPYIPLEKKNTIMKDVLFEPELALFVENEDSFFEELISGAKQRLKEDGKLYIEIRQEAASKLIELGKKNGFNQIVVKKDLSGKDRMMKFN